MLKILMVKQKILKGSILRRFEEIRGAFRANFGSARFLN